MYFDEKKLNQEAEKCRSDYKTSLEYEAIIACVVSLGSFFSGDLCHPQELDIVHFAKGCIEDHTFSRVPSIPQIVAWLLRTIYRISRGCLSLRGHQRRILCIESSMRVMAMSEPDFWGSCLQQ